MFLLIAVALVLHPAVLLAVLALFTAISGKAAVAWLLAASGSLLFGMAVSPNLKQTWQTSIKNDSGAAVVADPPLVITYKDEVNFCVIIPPTETAEIDKAVTVANIQSAFITGNQPCDVYTNSADGTGGQHLVLDPNGNPKVPSIFWHVGMGTPNPFTPDITKFYVKNNGTANAVVRASFGCDLA